MKGCYRQEIGSLQPGPDLNQAAPDFTLKTVDGKEEVTLSKLVGPKPVVLIFGNFTCGPFCSQSGNVQKLYERYKDRATFVMVYVREAHPKDGWVMSSNEAIGVSLRQPLTYEERVGVAQMCTKKLKFGMPMLVDTIDDTVGARYSGMPSRLYLIDGQGKVAFKNGRGPFGFKTAELENALLWMLNEPESSVAAKGRVELKTGCWRGDRRGEGGGKKRLPFTPFHFGLEPRRQGGVTLAGSGCASSSPCRSSSTSNPSTTSSRIAIRSTASSTPSSVRRSWRSSLRPSSSAS